MRPLTELRAVLDAFAARQAALQVAAGADKRPLLAAFTRLQRAAAAGSHREMAAADRRLHETVVALADVLTRPTTAPAILVAAITHGELIAVQPFRWGSGLIARAAVRLVLAARGVDPDLLGCPEAGMLSLGRTTYVASVRAYRSGEPEGVAEWIRWNASAIGFGASSDAPQR